VVGEGSAEQEFFLVSSNVAQVGLADLRRDALSQRELTRLLGSVGAARKVMLMDTCHAGAMGDAMLASLNLKQLAGDGAMRVLAQAVGSTVISASTPQQQALEGHQGHGLWCCRRSMGEPTR